MQTNGKSRTKRKLISINFLFSFKFTDDRAQHSDVGVVKSRSFLTLLASLSNSAAASVRIDILSGVTNPSVPLVLGVRLLAPLDREFGPLGVPGEPDFLWRSELKKFARTPSPDGAPGASFASIYKVTSQCQSMAIVETSDSFSPFYLAILDQLPEFSVMSFHPIEVFSLVKPILLVVHLAALVAAAAVALQERLARPQ